MDRYLELVPYILMCVVVIVLGATRVVRVIMINIIGSYVELSNKTVTQVLTPIRIVISVLVGVVVSLGLSEYTKVPGLVMYGILLVYLVGVGHIIVYRNKYMDCAELYDYFVKTFGEYGYQPRRIELSCLGEVLTIMDRYRGVVPIVFSVKSSTGEISYGAGTGNKLPRLYGKRGILGKAHDWCNVNYVVQLEYHSRENGVCPNLLKSITIDVTTR